MTKSFIFGLAVLMFIGFISFFIQDVTIFMASVGFIGISSVLISGIITGAFQQKRAPGESYPFEDKHIRDWKSRWSGKVFMFGLPFLMAMGAAFIIYSL